MFLKKRQFALIAYQRSIAYVLDSRKQSKAGVSKRRLLEPLHAAL